MKKYILIVFSILCVLLFGSALSNLFNSDRTNTPIETPDIVESVDFSKLVYTAVGDSITWGQDGMSGTQMQDTYVKLVGETLGLKKVYNNGIGWSTMASSDECSCHNNYDTGHTPMCKRYNQISIYSDIISVSAGVNDFGLVPLGDINSYDINTFYGAYNTFIKGVKENYSSAWLFLITPTPTKTTYSLDYKNAFGFSRADYYNAVIELGKKWNLSVCELHNIEDIYLDITQNGSDGVHPSQSCVNNTIAPIVSQFIKDNYNK